MKKVSEIARERKRKRYRVLCLREGNISSDAIAWRFSTRGTLLQETGGSRGLSMSCNGQPDLWGGPSNFPVDGGKLVGQVAYYHFSIRRARGRCVRVDTSHARALPCHYVHSVLVPLALDKGIGDVRGCSLWLVWVGLTIWIHGTVITTVLPLSF